MLTYFLHEENWRVNGQMCEPFGPVRMADCDEGDIVHGYRNLAWVTASIGFCCGLAMILTLPKLLKSNQIFVLASKTLGFHPLPFAFPCGGIILGTAFIAYFITLLLFTVSTGEHTNYDSEWSPWGSINKWEFHMPERILVFFEVGMMLWWLSFISHAIEYMTACTTSDWFFSSKTQSKLSLARTAVHTFFRYHCGSVLLASALVPTGRFFRNVFAAIRLVLRKLPINNSCLSCWMVVLKPCLLGYDYWFKFMTSDGLAYQSIVGTPFLNSARHGYYLVKRNDDKCQAQMLLNSGNIAIWLFQLVIMLSGLVFVVWWLQYDDQTFREFPSFQVTSITAMGCYELVITWFLAQIYGSFVRGFMHGGVQAYLVDMETSSGHGTRDNPFALYFSSQNPATLETDNFDTTKGKDTAKIAPAPVEGMMNQKSAGELHEVVGLSLKMPRTAGEALQPHELSDDARRVPITAPRPVPPASATQAEQRVQDIHT